MLLNSRKRSLSDHSQWLFFLCGLLLKIQEVKVKSSSLFMCVLIWGWAGNGNFLKVVACLCQPISEQAESFLHQIHSAVFSCESNANSFQTFAGKCSSQSGRTWENKNLSECTVEYIHLSLCWDSSCLLSSHLTLAFASLCYQLKVLTALLLHFWNGRSMLAKICLELDLEIFLPWMACSMNWHLFGGIEWKDLM